MSTQAQRIALAEATGWQRDERCKALLKTLGKWDDDK